MCRRNTEWKWGCFSQTPHTPSPTSINNKVFFFFKSCSVGFNLARSLSDEKKSPDFTNRAYPQCTVVLRIINFFFFFWNGASKIKPGPIKHVLIIFSRMSELKHFCSVQDMSAHNIPQYPDSYLLARKLEF